MAKVERLISTSRHTYKVRFDDNYQQEGLGAPHDTEILAMDGEPLDEEESVSIILQLTPDEFQEIIYAISDTVPAP